MLLFFMLHNCEGYKFTSLGNTLSTRSDLKAVIACLEQLSVCTNYTAMKSKVVSEHCSFCAYKQALQQQLVVLMYVKRILPLVW